MRTKRSIVTISIVLAALLTSCSSAQSADAPLASTSDTKEEAAPLVTEEDFRNALVTASEKEKLQIYDEFSAGYKLKEDEYIEYAYLCEKNGDSKKQRDILYKLYTIDPTEAHGELLAKMTYRITDKDDDKAAAVLGKLIDEIKKCGDDDFSTEGIKNVIGSDEWKGSFYIDNGTFTSKTEYSDASITASVTSDALATRVVAVADNVRYLCDISYQKERLGHVGLNGDIPEGEYCYRLIENGVDTVLVNGYYKEGHYVNQLEITAGGVKYKGSFDDSGKTTEKQPEGIDGVAYAYSEDERGYLYVEGATVSDFVADAEKLGFEGFEE